MEARNPSTPPLKPGDVIHVEEPDYMYGVGPLFLRVIVVGRIEHLTDGPWVNLMGIALRADGSQLRAEPRVATVRVAGIRPFRSSEGTS
jgi:hypothetical protein